MEDVTIPGRDSDRGQFNQVMAQYDAPAYVRRARRVEEALTALLTGCRQRREEWLEMVRLRLGTLHGLAGEWQALQGLVGQTEREVLERMYAELQPQLRVPVMATPSEKALRTALAELNESIERFNRRWRAFLAEVDLRPLNELREGYNRYYVLEKECSVRSSRLASHGFQRLEMLTGSHLERWLPPLPVIAAGETGTPLRSGANEAAPASIADGAGETYSGL